MKTDKISVRGITAYGTHGVLDFEHHKPQKFSVDVSYYLCTEEAIAADDIKKTVSYADVAAAAVARIEGPHLNLIETLADLIAQDVLDLGVRCAKVTVHKPRAPLPQDFDDVKVSVFREGQLLTDGPYRVVIALGGNLGDPESAVWEAMGKIACTVLYDAECSSLYRSAPVLAPGQDPQPDYINAVVVGRYLHSPLELLQELHEIENEYGRVRAGHWGARTLDLDIVEIEGMTSQDPELILPHPYAHLRRFVLDPWAEIVPNARLKDRALTDWIREIPGGAPQIVSKRPDPFNDFDFASGKYSCDTSTDGGADESGEEDGNGFPFPRFD